jgi:hypothetical protein
VLLMIDHMPRSFFSHLGGEHNLPHPACVDWSSLSDCLEIVNRWIAALSERKIDPLHHKIMDFAAFLEGDFAQGFVDRFG